MTREDCTPSSQSEVLSQPFAHPVEETQRYPSDISKAPSFSVTESVTFKSVMPERDAHPLPPTVARLVSLVSLGTVMLLPLSGCGTQESSVPCPVPTPRSNSTLVPDGTPTATCKTSSGSHYVWIHSRGGWVQSDDGVHPRAGARGVGAIEESSGEGSNRGHSSTSGSGEESSNSGHGSGGEEGHGGVGSGHGGSGHGGGGG